MPTHRYNVFNEIVPEMSVEIQLILCGQADGKGSHFSCMFGLLGSPLGFPQASALHSHLLGGRPVVRGTVGSLVHSPHDGDGFSAAPNLLLK